MKTIILFILFAGFVFSQSPYYGTVTVDSAETLSDSIKISRGNQLGGLFVAQGITDSIQFQVSKDGINWNWLQNASTGSIYTVLIDSSMASAVAIDPRLCFPFNWWKVSLGDAIADDDNTSIKTVEVPYLSKEPK